MNKKLIPGLLIAAFSIVISCITAPSQRLDDPNFYDKYGTFHISKSTEQCFEASKRALIDMGFKIIKKNNKKLTLISNRRPVTSYGEIHETSKSTSFQMNTKIYVKYYIKVEGDKKSSTIKIIRMNLYHNMSEVNEEAIGFVRGRVKDFKKALMQALDDQDF